MGAFFVFDIAFETRKDRDKFEKVYGIRKKDILVDENAKCIGVAWTMLRNPELDPIYFMGFMGYADPKEIFRDCLKDKVKIKSLRYIPINDDSSRWKKIAGRKLKWMKRK